VAAPLREAREQRQHAVERPVGLPSAPGRAGQAEVLHHRQRAEDAAAFRHHGDAAPGAAERRFGGRVRAVDQHLAAPRRHLAHQGADQRGLAHAVPAHEADASPGRIAKSTPRSTEPAP
jgi:hypothetical protein